MQECEQLFKDSIIHHRDLSCNKNLEKYSKSSQRIVEPNLSKRMEDRKRRTLFNPSK